MTKGIYLNKKTEVLLSDYCAKNELTVSKAINVLIQSVLDINTSSDSPEIHKETKQTKKEKESVKTKSIAEILQEKRRNKRA